MFSRMPKFSVTSCSTKELQDLVQGFLIFVSAQINEKTAAALIAWKNANLYSILTHLFDGFDDGHGFSGSGWSKNDVGNSGNTSGNDFLDLKLKKLK